MKKAGIVALCCIYLGLASCGANTPAAAPTAEQSAAPAAPTVVAEATQQPAAPPTSQPAPTAAAPGAQPTSGQAGQVVTVALLPFTGYAPIYLAEQENRCAAYGIQLKLVETDSQNALDTVMAKGDADVGMYANTSLAFAAAGGVPLRAFLTLDQSVGADGIVVAGNVRSIEDMVKQKTRFAANETDVNYFLFMAVASEQGYAPGDFNQVPLGGANALSAFLTSNVDAVGISEPLLSKALQRAEAHVLFTSKEHPGYISDVFVASQTTLEQKGGDLVAFARCWYDTITRVQTGPETAIPLMAKRLGVEAADMRNLMPGIAWPGQQEGRAYLVEGRLRDSLQFANDFYGRLNQLPGNSVPPDQQISDVVVNQLP